MKSKNTNLVPHMYDGMPIDTSLVDDSESIGADTIVRLKTGYWNDRNGVYVKKELRYMKRISGGAYNLIAEDAPNIGVEGVVSRITNLFECDDGLYTIQMTNIGRDYESGHIDDYDYILIPFNPPQSKT